MESVLVTGASGFLGRQLCGDLTEKGYSVTALCRAPSVWPIHGVKYIFRDFNSLWDESGFPHRIDSVVHLAQSKVFREFPEKALDIFHVNVRATAFLLDYAERKGCTNFVMASTGGLYGYSQHPHTEACRICIDDERDYYFASKKSSELLVSCYSETFSTTILRFFYLYGPNQDRSKLLPRLMDNIIQNKPILLDGEEGLRINPVHVRDASAAILAVLTTSKPGVYNISGNEVLSIRKIAESMGGFLNIQPVFFRRSDAIRGQIGDNRKMIQDLHYPQWKLMECLGQIKG